MTLYAFAWLLTLWALWAMHPGLDAAIGFWVWALGFFAYVLYRNHAPPAGYMVLAGMASNALVMVANGGYMPASVVSPKHATGEGAMPFLGDVLPLVQASVGDALIVCGIVLLATQAVRMKVTA